MLSPDIPDSRPRFRGVSHLLAFLGAAPVGLVLVLEAKPGVAELAATAFSTSVTAMLGVSALLHRRPWPPPQKRWLTALDHTMIYVLIAGTYTPVALLVLHAGWRVPILVGLWGGAVLGALVKLVRPGAPRWFSAGTCLLLGWVSIMVWPQIVEGVGLGGSTLLLLGGLAYTIGAFVYVLQRPDPRPSTFGYHEVFHALVVVAVTCQYVSIAFFVLPRA
jgi:hemolysin III